MKKIIASLFSAGIILLAGCSSSHILVTSNKYHFPHTHDKIMTVGVVNKDNDSTRLHIEKSISGDLKNLGYNAVSAVEEFGTNGLSNMGQAETYLKLCSEGIDAVLVITLIDKSKESQFKTRKNYTYPDNYYFDRIWNYKNIQADLSGKSPGKRSTYFWEAILFNLRTLEAECTIQSSSFTSLDQNKAADFEKLLVKKMLRQKILKRQNNPAPKPF